MEKYFCGATERDDKIMFVGSNQYDLFYGGGDGYLWREHFFHRPTMSEIKKVIRDHIDAMTEEKIVEGGTYEDQPIWLGKDTQMNLLHYANMSEEERELYLTFPMEYKINEDENGDAVNITLDSYEDLKALASAASCWVVQCIAEGRAEKENVDWSKFQL